MRTWENEIVSEDLKTCLITFLWMVDNRKENRIKRIGTDFNIKFDDFPPEMVAQLKGWFNGMLGLINGVKHPTSSQYKIDLGKRIGCFPVSMDQSRIHIICDYYDG